MGGHDRHLGVHRGQEKKLLMKRYFLSNPTSCPPPHPIKNEQSLMSDVSFEITKINCSNWNK